jgi:hemerythrin
MPEIKWDDNLSIGIDMIDNQHKMLISKLKDLSVAVGENKGTNIIMKTLDFLIDYTDFHFSTEEKHMKEQGYPDIDYHVKQHGEFKETVNNLMTDFDEEGATEDLTESVNQLLLIWYIKHITNVDMKFGKFLQEKGLEDLKE